MSARQRSVSQSYCFDKNALGTVRLVLRHVSALVRRCRRLKRGRNGKFSFVRARTRVARVRLSEEVLSSVHWAKHKVSIF